MCWIFIYRILPFPLLREYKNFGQGREVWKGLNWIQTLTRPISVLSSPWRRHHQISCVTGQTAGHRAEEVLRVCECGVLGALWSVLSFDHGLLQDFEQMLPAECRGSAPSPETQAHRLQEHQPGAVSGSFTFSHFTYLQNMQNGYSSEKGHPLRMKCPPLVKVHCSHHGKDSNWDSLYFSKMLNIPCFWNFVITKEEFGVDDGKKKILITRKRVLRNSGMKCNVC